jgi:dihydroorotate dehydrogenase (NAD+) catalytic subunit
LPERIAGLAVGEGVTVAETAAGPRLAVDVGGLRMKNPVLPGSGTFAYTGEYESSFDLGVLGALVTKSTFHDPWPGNAPPRVAETAAGMLNSIGLQGYGVDYVCREILPRMRRYGAPIVASISGHTLEEYVAVAERFAAEDGVAALEVNISCPNLKAGGMLFGADPAVTQRLTEMLVEAVHLPVIPKLTPNCADITEIARAAEAGGAHAVSLINTLVGMGVDVRTRRPTLGTIGGGLSGPAIKPVALHMVWRVCRAVRIPVIGGGGIMTAEDALEFLIVGARAVSVGTVNFTNPLAMPQIIAGISGYLEENRIADVNELVGTLRTGKD